MLRVPAICVGAGCGVFLPVAVLPLSLIVRNVLYCTIRSRVDSRMANLLIRVRRRLVAVLPRRSYSSNLSVLPPWRAPRRAKQKALPLKFLLFSSFESTSLCCETTFPCLVRYYKIVDIVSSAARRGVRWTCLNGHDILKPELSFSCFNPRRF